MEIAAGILISVFLVALYMFLTAKRIEENLRALTRNIMIGVVVLIILILIFF